MALSEQDKADLHNTIAALEDALSPLSRVVKAQPDDSFIRAIRQQTQWLINDIKARMVGDI